MNQFALGALLITLTSWSAVAGSPSKLKIITNSNCSAACGLFIQNVDDRDITITKITLNDRDDCPVRYDLFGREFDSVNLAAGDSVTLVTTCGIVRAAITTQDGLTTYNFNRQAPASNSYDFLAQRPYSASKPAIADSGKRDILGYRLGMTKDEMTAKLIADQIKCSLKQPPPELIDVSDCYLKNGSEVLSISVARDLEPNIVVGVSYGFLSGASDLDQVDSVIEQYRPKQTDPLGIPLPGIPRTACGARPSDLTRQCDLGNDILLYFGPVSGKPWNWAVTLFDVGTIKRLSETNKQRQVDERKRLNPPTKF
jgi:hypothetical protein